MAYRAFKPQEAKFKKVTNNRGKKVDRFAAEIKTATGFNPWSSNYDIDFNHSLAKKQEPPMKESNVVGFKKYNALNSQPSIKKKNNFTNNDSNLNRLNDAVSVNTWEVRGHGIGNSGQNSYARQNNGPRDDGSPKRIMTAHHISRNKNGTRGSANNFGNSNVSRDFDSRQNRSQLTIVSSKANAGKNDNSRVMQVGKGPGASQYESQKNNAFKKKARPVTAINQSKQGNFFGMNSPREIGSRGSQQYANDDARLDSHRSGAQKNLQAIVDLVKYTQNPHEIDPLAEHLNKKQIIMNHPHHNFNSYGQAGDWNTAAKNYGRPNTYNVPEPTPAHLEKVGIKPMKKPMVKESQYNNDYPNWGKIPRSVNLNPGLQKTCADNMPFFGKATNKDYGGFPGDNGLAVALFTKPNDQKNLLGVDMPLLAETAARDHYKPFMVGKNGTHTDLLPPKLSKVEDKYPTFDYQYKSSYKQCFGNVSKMIDDLQKDRSRDEGHMRTNEDGLEMEDL